MRHLICNWHLQEFRSRRNNLSCISMICVGAKTDLINALIDNLMKLAAIRMIRHLNAPVHLSISKTTANFFVRMLLKREF